jgi:hypothetical protein
MSRSSLPLRIYLWILLFSLTGLRLPAQTNFGRISGTVSDTSGAIVSGVRVIITNMDTQAVRPVTTDDHGLYVADNLPVGPYSVSVEQPVFKRAAQRGRI